MTNAGILELATSAELPSIANTGGTIQIDFGDTVTLDGGSISGGSIDLAEGAGGPIQSISEITVPGLSGIAPALSGDGQYVAFIAVTDLPRENGGEFNAPAVELYDSANGQLTDISALVPSADLHPGENFNDIPSISTSGQYVLFDGQYQVLNFNSGN